MSSTITGPVIRLRARNNRPSLELLAPNGGWKPFEDGDAGQAQKRVTGQVSPDATLVAVIGAGLGAIVEAIADVAPAAHIVALELSRELVAAAISQPAIRDRVDRGELTLAWAPAFEGLAALRPKFVTAGEFPVLVNPRLATEHPSLVAEARRILQQQVFEARANEDARRANAGRYLLNTLRNLSAIAREGDVSALTGLFAGAPAVVVAAGPSLDRSLDDIRAVADRAIVICVDTALKPLLAAGVQPSLVVAMDPTDTNARHLYDIPALESTWLVAEPSVDPAILRPFAGRTFLLSLGFDPWPWIAESGVTRGKLRAWGSVTTTAYDLALILGCNPIGLVGADFSFPEGRPYCRNVEYEHDWAEAAARGQPLTDIWRGWTSRWKPLHEPDAGGTPTLTAPHLVAFRDWVRKDIERVAGERRIFNAGGGILTGSTIPRSSLREGFIGEIAVRDVASRLRAAHAAPEHGQRLEHIWSDLRTTVASTSSPLDAWRRFASNVSVKEIESALAPQAAAELSLVPGPHIRLEESLRLRALLTAKRPEGLVAVNPSEAIDARELGSLCARVCDAAAEVRGYAPQSETEAGAGRTTAASTLFDWRGRGYALVRQLESRLGQVAPTPDEDARPLQPIVDGRTSFRLDARQAAKHAVTRQTALTMLACASDRLASTIVRAMDPVRVEGRIHAELTVGGLAASGSIEPGDLGRVVTGRTADGASSKNEWVSQAGSIAIRLMDPSCLSPLRFLSGDAREISIERPTYSGVATSLFAMTLGDGTALLNPILKRASVAVSEDGSAIALPEWPLDILGEIAATEGSSVAWNNTVAEASLMRRLPDGRVDIVEPAPFRPNRVIEWMPGQFLCAGFSGGLWLWTPGAAPRQVSDAPPTISLIRTNDSVRIDPVVRSAQGYTQRVMLDHAWIWRPDAALERIPLGPEGPCWSVARSGKWTAAAYPHADFVRVTHASGRTVDLGCYYPVTVAWAGSTLIVLSSTGGEIYRFGGF